jgi:tetratricopeptide (TPR) repeat protein
LASASVDPGQGGKGEVILWDLATGRQALSLPGNLTVAFSADGNRLAAAAADIYLASDVRVWDARGLSDAERATRRAAVPAEATAWHRQQADECQADKRWEAASFHLGRVIAAFPEEWETRSARGYALAAGGHWAEAAKDFRRAVELAPPIGRLWFHYALVLLAAGDRDGYRRHCAALLERHGRTGDPERAIWLAWNCKMTPDALPDLGPVIALAEKAVAANPRDGFRLNNLAGALFRAGRYRDCVARLRECLNLTPAGGSVWDWVWLAMAHARLGEMAEARFWLGRATKWIDENAGESTWDQRLELQLLRKEAEALVKPG